MTGFRIGAQVKLKMKFSLNQAQNPCMWGIDLDKGKIGEVIKRHKASDFGVSMGERYEVSFSLGNGVSLVAVLFPRQIEAAKKGK